ncbi:hypothetical protein BVRB_7g171620 [Beta vulgaris subsp. vulgaris]|nr:hypothetical protein BVRB_7g171620 [Beta vulgaris subsp. vulgaris]
MASENPKPPISTSMPTNPRRSRPRVGEITLYDDPSPIIVLHFALR